jgi:hypothetical protein
MGCDGYKVNEFSKKRKELKSFDIEGFSNYIIAIDKYNLVIAISQNKIVAIDYEALIIKSETEYDFGEHELEFQSKFSNKDDIIEIRAIDFLNKVIHVLKLKASANGIVESSKDKESIPNFPEPDNKMSNLAFYDNGSVIMFIGDQLESSNKKVIAYIDKNGKVLSKCDVPKDVEYQDCWHNEKYAAFISYKEVSINNIKPCKRKAADTLYVYKLSDMSQVAEILVKKSGINLEASKVVVSPANDNELLLSFFGQIHVLDLESGKIVRIITFCSNEKSHMKILIASDNTFWSISEKGHCHQWKLNGKTLIATTGSFSSKFAILKKGRKVALFSDTYDEKNRTFTAKLKIESNEEFEADTNNNIA